MTVNLIGKRFTVALEKRGRHFSGRFMVMIKEIPNLYKVAQSAFDGLTEFITTSIMKGLG